MILGQKMT